MVLYGLPKKEKIKKTGKKNGGSNCGTEILANSEARKLSLELSFRFERLWKL